MKNIYPFALCLLTILLISCQKDELTPKRKTGQLKLNIGLEISVNEVDSKLKSGPRTEDFSVTIYLENGTEAISFDNASDMPDTIELEIGNYYVEAHSENNVPAAFENPYYFGLSDVFTINSNLRSTVQVNCELANSIVTVQYSDNVINSFFDYKTTVYSTPDSLVFLKDEIRKGYFQTSSLDILVELNYTTPGGSDASKLISGQIPETLPNKHYEILIDASIDAGMAFLNINLDSTTLQVEAVRITDSSNPPPTGSIGYGEILITEIMANPSALSDTEGEWFEIYNNSDQPVNLQNLILGRDDANRHIITDSIILPAWDYLVFERTGLATDATKGYVYGSDILLTNTGAVLSIYNEGTEINPGALIFSVNYGETSFPDGTGASISLNPNMISAADAIAGTSWCISTSFYSTGDFGTPGEVNDICPWPIP